MNNGSFSNILKESQICLDLKGSNKDEILEELISILYENELIDDRDEFKVSVLEREDEGATGVGNGIAIPHGKSNSVLKTSVIIGRSNKDIDWDSIDDKPVNLFILFAIKSIDQTMHLKLLSKIASSLCDDSVVDKLKTTDDKREVISLLSSESKKEEESLWK